MPTTITVYFRLLAGLTSFISKRCRVHFVSTGPSGMFDAQLQVTPYFNAPARTASGTEMNPATTISVNTSAARLRAAFHRGCDAPSVCSMLHTPCRR